MEPTEAKMTVQKLSALDTICFFPVQTNVLITGGPELGTSDACTQPHGNTHTNQHCPHLASGLSTV